MHHYDITQGLLPLVSNNTPSDIIEEIMYLKRLYKLIDSKEDFTSILRRRLSVGYEGKDGKPSKPSEKLTEDFKYIDKNQNTLYQIYKYCVEFEYFVESEIELINKISNFVESGILLDE